MRRLDPVLHSPSRIAIMARLLVHGPERFSDLRDGVALTGGTLSSHLDVLTEAGYVATRTGFVRLRPAKVVSATARGRDAFLDYVTQIEALAAELRIVADAEGRR